MPVKLPTTAIQAGVAAYHGSDTPKPKKPSTPLPAYYTGGYVMGAGPADLLLSALEPKDEFSFEAEYDHACQVMRYVAKFYPQTPMILEFSIPKIQLEDMVKNKQEMHSCLSHIVANGVGDLVYQKLTNTLSKQG